MCCLLNALPFLYKTTQTNNKEKLRTHFIINRNIFLFNKNASSKKKIRKGIKKKIENLIKLSRLETKIHKCMHYTSLSAHCCWETDVIVDMLLLLPLAIKAHHNIVDNLILCRKFFFYARRTCTGFINNVEVKVMICIISNKKAKKEEEEEIILNTFYQKTLRYHLFLLCIHILSLSQLLTLSW